MSIHFSEEFFDAEIYNSFRLTNYHNEQNLYKLIHYDRQFFRHPESKRYISLVESFLKKDFITQFEIFIKELLIKKNKILAEDKDFIIELEDLLKYSEVHNLFLSDYHIFSFMINTYLFKHDKIQNRIKPMIIFSNRDYLKKIETMMCCNELNESKIGKHIFSNFLVKRIGSTTYEVCNKGFKSKEGLSKLLIAQSNDAKSVLKEGRDLPELDESIATQYLTLVEPYSKSSRNTNFALSGYLNNSFCQKFCPGANIYVGGVIEKFKVEKGQKFSYDLSLNITMIFLNEKDNRQILKKNESDVFLKLLRKDDLVKNLESIIFKNIEGHDFIKKALVLQLFSGKCKVLSNGSKIRSDIHILLVGNAGLAKSQFLKIVSNLINGLFATAAGSSGVGLTAAVIKDEKEGQWMIEAGAFVLADQSIICLDEADKIKMSEIASIHEAMEQQTVSINKAGVSATLNCRTSVLAAANPKFSKFSKAEAILDQLNFPVTLLSRFDLIFAIMDNNTVEEDKKIISKIFHNFTKIKNETEKQYTFSSLKKDIENNNTTAEILEKLVKNKELFHKFRYYVKDLKTPVFPEEIEKEIKIFYLKLKNEKKVVSYRQLESILRLTEIKSKLRGSTEVSLEDFIFSTELFRAAIKTVYPDENLEMDIDILETGIKKSDKANLNLIYKSISSEPFKTKRTIVKEFSNLSEDVIIHLLKNLERLGLIYQQEKNKYASIK